MGAKSEALVKQFEAKAQEALDTLDRLSEEDWKKITEGEQWSVGVTAHHLAGSFQPVSDAVKRIVAGQPLGFTMDTIHEMNAKHAKDFANCNKAETVDLLKKGTKSAAAVVRGLSDDQLAKSGTFGPGGPAFTAEQLITMALIEHVDEHLGSIRKTVGK